MDGRRMDLMVIDTKGKYNKTGKPFRLWIGSVFMSSVFVYRQMDQRQEIEGWRRDSNRT
jgi:hypothetical protein